MKECLLSFDSHGTATLIYPVEMRVWTCVGERIWFISRLAKKFAVPITDKYLKELSLELQRRYYYLRDITKMYAAPEIFVPIFHFFDLIEKIPMWKGITSPVWLQHYRKATKCLDKWLSSIKLKTKDDLRKLAVISRYLEGAFASIYCRGKFPDALEKLRPNLSFTLSILIDQGFEKYLTEYFPSEVTNFCDSVNLGDICTISLSAPHPSVEGDIAVVVFSHTISSANHQLINTMTLQKLILQVYVPGARRLRDLVTRRITFGVSPRDCYALFCLTTFYDIIDRMLLSTSLLDDFISDFLKFNISKDIINSFFETFCMVSRMSRESIEKFYNEVLSVSLALLRDKLKKAVTSKERDDAVRRIGKWLRASLALL